MDDDIVGYAMIYQPTLGERFWRALGFRFCLGQDPTDDPKFDPGKFSGWMKTTTHLKFDWRDRLRLLATGHLQIDLTQHTTQQVDESVNRTDFRIYAPFEKDG